MQADFNEKGINKGILVLGIMAILGLVAIAYFMFSSNPILITYKGDNTRIIQQDFSHKSLSFNNVTLTDHTQYFANNTCLASNLGMDVYINPCQAYPMAPNNVGQDVDFTWHGASPQLTSWIFVYEGQLQSGNMQYFNANETYSTTQQVQVDQWIVNFPLNNVFNYTNLGAPNGNCQLGSVHNSQMYNVSFIGNTTGSTVYCFTTVQGVNATSFLLTGNASVIATQQVNKTGIWHNVPVEYLGSNLLGTNFSFYGVSNYTFQPGESVKTRWHYTPAGNSTTGKWHILGYAGQGVSDLANAITNGNYVYSDPSWVTTLDVGLHAFYKFNETSGTNIQDWATEINNGTITKTNQLSQNGIISTAMKVNGSNQNIMTVVDSQTLNFSDTNFTISFWVNQSGGDNFGGIAFEKRVSGDILMRYENNNTLSEGHCFQFDRRDGGDKVICTGTNELTPGILQMVTVVYNNVNMTIFLNGTWKASVSYTEQLGSNDGNWIFRCESTPCNKGETFDELGVWNRSLSFDEVTQLYNSGAGISWHDQSSTASGNFTVTLLTPSNNTVSGNVSYNFTISQTAEGQFNHSNSTILIWNSSNALIYNNLTTVTANGTKTITWQVLNLTPDTFKWNELGCFKNSSGFGVCNLSITGNFTFTIDQTPPVINISSPVNNTVFLTSSFPYNVTFFTNASDMTLNACWINSNDDLTNRTFVCNNITNVSFNSAGNKLVTAFANDTLASVGKARGNLTILYYNYTTTENLDPIAEGTLATFNLTVNMVDLPSTSAMFKYNNTIYAPNSQVNTQNQTIFGVNFVIPSGYGNSSGKLQFYNWTFNITGLANITVATDNQTVISPSISDCSAGGVVILNFTHKDEANRSAINLSLGNNLQVDLTLSSFADNSVFFHYNTTKINSGSLQVCVAPGVLNNTSYKLDLTGSYVATNYVQEFFYIDNGTINLTSSTQNYSWYDLPLADSTTFLFTFLDENGIEVPGVIVHTLRYYIGNGQFLEVERSKEDNNGETHIHLVEEDVIYKFRITLQNQEIFLSDQYNAKCLSSPCSITLSAEADTQSFPTVYNNLPEGTYDVQSNRTSRQVTLFFNLNQSATMNLTVYTSDNNAVQSVASGTTTGSSGSVVVIVPFSYGNATYSANVYKDGQFVGTKVVDLSERANDYFGALGLFLAGLGVLCLALIGASHGEWVIIWTIVGLIAMSSMFLADLPWYALMNLIAGASVFLVKLIARKR